MPNCSGRGRLRVENFQNFLNSIYVQRMGFTPKRPGPGHMALRSELLLAIVFKYHILTLPLSLNSCFSRGVFFVFFSSALAGLCEAPLSKAIKYNVPPDV